MNKYEYRKVLFGPNYSNSECIFSTKNKFLHSRILNQSSSLDQIIWYLLFSAIWP